jgi:hypothetical protein
MQRYLPLDLPPLLRPFSGSGGSCNHDFQQLVITLYMASILGYKSHIMA